MTFEVIKGRDEEVMTRGTAGGGKTGIEALEKDEGGKSDGRMQLGAMQGVCDENRKFSLGMGQVNK